MKGLELSRQFYETYGVPMLEEQFADLLPHLAVGLVGSGSECLGYDDALSQDHDFEPGFCLFLPGEEVVDSRRAFALERAYAKLPKEFLGFTRVPLSPVGGNRHGVLRLPEFLTAKTGHPQGVLGLQDWLTIPEQSLAEVTGGDLFRDDGGVFTAIRATLRYLPEEVRQKKLAGRLWEMGQAGQYNYGRCIARGETGAAQLAVGQFVHAAIHAIHLLGRAYLPYYKWQFRGMQGLPLGHLAADLERLLSTGNTPEEAQEKSRRIEMVCAAIGAQVRAQGLSDHQGDTMEGLAYGVNNRIPVEKLRNLHILAGI